MCVGVGVGVGVGGVCVRACVCACKAMSPGAGTRMAGYSLGYISANVTLAPSGQI